MKKEIKTKLNLILSAIIFVLAMIIFAIVIVSKSTGIPPTIFGRSFHLVVSDSMTPEINVGDFVVAKKVDYADIKIGDYIVFKSPDESLKGILIIHSVKEINIVDGRYYFTTIGIKKGAIVDPYPATEVYGKYVWKSTFVGKIVTFFSNPINWGFAIFIVIMIKIVIKLFKNTIKLAKEERMNENKK